MKTIYKVTTKFGNGQRLHSYFDDLYEAYDFAGLAIKERGTIEIDGPCVGGIAVHKNAHDALETLLVLSKYGKAA